MSLNSLLNKIWNKLNLVQALFYHHVLQLYAYNKIFMTLRDYAAIKKYNSIYEISGKTYISQLDHLCLHKTQCSLLHQPRDTDAYRQ